MLKLFIRSILVGALGAGAISFGDQVVKSSGHAAVPAALPAKCDCECQPQVDKCDEFMASLPAEARGDVVSCHADPRQATTPADIITRCLHGASDFAKNAAMGMIGLPAAVGAIVDQANECNRSPLAKYSLLSSVHQAYTKGMLKIMIETWTCAEIAREANRRGEAFAKSIDSQRRALREHFENAGEVLNADDPKLEAALGDRLSENEKLYLRPKRRQKFRTGPVIVPAPRRNSFVRT